jgi:integrase
MYQTMTRQSDKPKRLSAVLKKPVKMTDARVEALVEFKEIGTYPDVMVKGLLFVKSPQKYVWRFERRQRINGRRSATCKTLGEYPMMKIDAARKAAEIAAAELAIGKMPVNRRATVKFEAAFTAYVEYLKAKAEAKGKPARWAYNVEKLGKIILPEFSGWPLSDLANSPDAVADFHKKTTRDHGPVSANKCAQVIRATYRRAARRDRTLPAVVPTSAVDFNPEKASQKAIDFKAFPAWLEAWRKIDSGIRQAYHLTGLLTGARPGELARLKWGAYSDNEQQLTISNPKATYDIVLPVTPEIAAALRMARDDAQALGYDTSHDAPMFPGCSQKGHRDALPMRGNALRHTYRTLAADMKIDSLIAHFLLGHTPEGISQKYIAVLILQSGKAMLKEQNRMSRRFLELLSLDTTAFRAEIAAALVRSRQTGEGKVLERAGTLAKAQRISARKRRGRVLGPRQTAI